MSRLAGQISFWIGLLAWVCGIVSLSVDDWQVAPGGIKMGLWRNCQSGTCSTISDDGLSQRQRSSLWGCRIILILVELSAMVAMYVCKTVVMQQGSRTIVIVGLVSYAVASFFSMIVMASYMDGLKLPDIGVHWSFGMIFVILNWLIVYPLAAVFLSCALWSRAYGAQKRNNSTLVSVQLSPNTLPPQQQLQAQQPSNTLAYGRDSITSQSTDAYSNQLNSPATTVSSVTVTSPTSIVLTQAGRTLAPPTGNHTGNRTLSDARITAAAREYLAAKAAASKTQWNESMVETVVPIGRYSAWVDGEKRAVRPAVLAATEYV